MTSLLLLSLLTAAPTKASLERTVRENYAQNIRRFFITDDNFARNSDWEALFDRLIEHARQP